MVLNEWGLINPMHFSKHVLIKFDVACTIVSCEGNVKIIQNYKQKFKMNLLLKEFVAQEENHTCKK